MIGNGEMIQAVVTQYCSQEDLRNGIMFVDTLSETQEDEIIYKAFSNRPDWVKLSEPFHREKDHDIYVVSPYLLQDMEKVGYAFNQNLIAEAEVLIPESHHSTSAYEQWFCFQHPVKTEAARPTNLDGVDACINAFIHSDVSKDQLVQLKDSCIIRHVKNSLFRRMLMMLGSEQDLTVEKQQEFILALPNYNLQSVFDKIAGA
jgi:hypothetical protein